MCKLEIKVHFSQIYCKLKKKVCIIRNFSYSSYFLQTGFQRFPGACLPPAEHRAFPRPSLAQKQERPPQQSLKLCFFKWAVSGDPFPLGSCFYLYCYLCCPPSVYICQICFFYIILFFNISMPFYFRLCLLSRTLWFRFPFLSNRLFSPPFHLFIFIDMLIMFALISNLFCFHFLTFPPFILFSSTE